MTDLQVHCPSCGQPLDSVLGVALINGVVLTNGKHRASLGPVQAAMIRELSGAPNGMTAQELVSKIYHDEARDNPVGVIRSVKRQLNRDLLPPFGLEIRNLVSPTLPAIYALTRIDEKGIDDALRHE